MTDGDESKCPVPHDQRDVWLKHSQQAQQAQQEQKLAQQKLAQQQDQPKCPVDNHSKDVWLKSGKKHGEAANDVGLASERDVSSIPRTGSEGNWVYPSEKQFFDAMKRKNWDPQPEDMKTIVPLHNYVNERVWRYINMWENGLGGDSCGGIKLTNFKGQSKKLTPRAWFRSTILGMAKPFDRHDWTIDRCGKTVDYVIDFYSEEVKTSKDNIATEPQIYLDVRPKLNSFEGIKMRILKSVGLL